MVTRIDKDNQVYFDPLAPETKHQSDFERSPSRKTNIDLYSAGWFDGLMGYSPELPHFKDYWDGYTIGYREYYCGLLGLEIPTNEISEERLRTLMAA